MNLAAVEENKRNEKFVQFRQTGAGEWFVVDGFNAKYQGVPVYTLNAAGRRKFENRILLSNMDKPRRGMPKIVYV
jgi:hypothetical protein